MKENSKLSMRTDITNDIEQNQKTFLPAGIFIAKTRETRQKIGSLRYDTFSMNRFRDMSIAIRIWPLQDLLLVDTGFCLFSTNS